MYCCTDQSMYAPGTEARLSLHDLPCQTHRLCLRLSHLEHLVWTMECEAAEQLSISLPPRDGQGYLLVVEALNSCQQLLARCHTAIDVSSSWTRFPRYGYLWDFSKPEGAAEKLEAMARYHLNGVQFYDWQYRHHQPVAEDLTLWQDWSGRTIRGDALRACLCAAHQKGMACMAYNMIYAANQTYQTDGSGVSPAWRLIKASGEDFTCQMDAALGPVGVLQYFNPLNPGWQAYLFAQERKVFEAFDFDGWHGDTIGENGPMQAADGGPLGWDENGQPIHLVKDCYIRFLNAAKEAVGSKYLAFNPVGAQGIQQVNVSHVDVLYTEFWPWDSDEDGLPYDSYFSIHKAILNACRQSGGKSLTVAAYINYRNPKPFFHPPAVRLMDCVVFASGGGRIELGNGNRMLSDEYFPADKNKALTEELAQSVLRLYDFLVAYENLLRDGQQPVQRKVMLENAPLSTDGQSDTVWCFAKADDKTEIYHFINLVGTDNLWRDVEQTKPEPLYQPELVTQIYTDFPVQALYLASPDGQELVPQPLAFQSGQDERGQYIRFTQPGLAYWNMIFLRRGA